MTIVDNRYVNKIVKLRQSPVRFLIPVFTLVLLVFAVVPTGAKNKEERRLKIKIVADQAFASQYHWEKIVQDYLHDIAPDLLHLLGIRVDIVGYETWYHPERIRNLYVLASNMVEGVEAGDAEAILGFTLDRRHRHGRDYRTGGVTIPFRGTVIRTYQNNELRNSFIPNVMIHEMVHLFGGVHVYDGSLMSPAFHDTIDLVLDPLNTEIVQLTQSIDFEERYRSLPPQSVNKLVTLYRRAISLGNEEIPTFLELGAMYQTQNNFNDAIGQFRKVVELSPDMLYAWLALGDCYGKSDRPHDKIAVYEEAAHRVAEKDVIYGELVVLYYNCGEYRKAYDSALMARDHGASIDPALWKELKSKM